MVDAKVSFAGHYAREGSKGSLPPSRMVALVRDPKNSRWLLTAQARRSITLYTVTVWLGALEIL